MAIYHGCKFIAVTAPNVNDCFVKEVEFKPSGQIGTYANEPTFLPIPEGLEQYPRFDCAKAAKTEVKKHIFSKTQNPIIERIVSVELTKFQIEELRLLDRNSVETQKVINGFKDDIHRMLQEIKQFKAIRRSLVTIQ